MRTIPQETGVGPRGRPRSLSGREIRKKFFRGKLFTMKAAKGMGWCIVAAVASLAVLGAIILSIALTKSAGRLDVNAHAADNAIDLELVAQLAEGSPDDASSLSSIGVKGSLRQSRSRKGGGQGISVASAPTKNSSAGPLDANTHDDDTDELDLVAQLAEKEDNLSQDNAAALSLSSIGKDESLRTSRSRKSQPTVSQTSELDEIFVEAVIVGAGWAGISTARDLQNSGHSSLLILEANDYVGGRSKSNNSLQLICLQIMCQ